MAFPSSVTSPVGTSTRRSPNPGPACRKDLMFRVSGSGFGNLPLAQARGVRTHLSIDDGENLRYASPLECHDAPAHREGLNDSPETKATKGRAVIEGFCFFCCWGLNDSPAARNKSQRTKNTRNNRGNREERFLPKAAKMRPITCKMILVLCSSRRLPSPRGAPPPHSTPPP
jgi:hypothetical protein